MVDAVGGRVPVLIDSGFRRGRDVVKALAIGVPGAQRVLEIVQAELVQAMATIGRPSLATLDRSAVRTDFP